MRFEKISKEQFKKDFEGWFIEYEDIKLPVRATKFSAGYDFFAPFNISLSPGHSLKIPTGIRVILDEDKCLKIYPRSGLGCKYRMQLDNTTPIIDADYVNSDNEGHIFLKITNDSREGKLLSIDTGSAMAQGIITQYFKVDNDNVENKRNGGFGSTDANNKS